MNCTNCGKPIAGEINFCPYCGKPIERGSASTDTAAWEYCQIEAYWEATLFSWRCYFWANAVGCNGTYSVGWSEQYSVRNNPPGGAWQKEGDLARNAHSGLVTFLVGDGWEAIPDRGESWWMLRFRRKECYPDFSVGQVESKSSNTFDGEWFSRSPGGAGVGILIGGNRGIYAAEFRWSGRTQKKGERVFRIEGVAGPKFVGESLGADGKWYPITGVLQGDVLYVRAPGSISSYQRRL